MHIAVSRTLAIFSIPILLLICPAGLQAVCENSILFSTQDSGDRHALASSSVAAVVTVLNLPPECSLEILAGQKDVILLISPSDPNTNRDIRDIYITIKSPCEIEKACIVTEAEGFRTILGDPRRITVSGDKIAFHVGAKPGRYEAVCVVSDEEYRTSTAVSWTVS